MAKEIERRFLPAADFDPAPLAHGWKDIRQSYIPMGDDLVMRLRETTTSYGVSHDLTFKTRETAMTNDEHPLPIEPGLYRTLRAKAGPDSDTRDASGRSTSSPSGIRTSRSSPRSRSRPRRPSWPSRHGPGAR